MIRFRNLGFGISVMWPDESNMSDVFPSYLYRGKGRHPSSNVQTNKGIGCTMHGVVYVTQVRAVFAHLPHIEIEIEIDWKSLNTRGEHKVWRKHRACTAVPARNRVHVLRLVPKGKIIDAATCKTRKKVCFAFVFMCIDCLIHLVSVADVQGIFGVYVAVRHRRGLMNLAVFGNHVFQQWKMMNT